MGAIRFSGMASGLPPNIVDQILDAERIPVKQMESKKAGEDDRLKLVTDLETKISDIPKTLGELTNTRGFTFNKIESGDPNIVNGMVDPNGAVTGEWQIEVMQLAQKPGAMSNGFPDRDKTELGVGYLKFKTPEGSKEVYISGKNSSLDAVASEINKANIGLRATVINDRKDKDTPFKLLITGLATGDDKQVNFPTVYMLDGDQDFFFETSKPAQNGRIKVDGFEFEVPENRVKDIVPGVTLQLRQAAPGREVTLMVKEDTDTISGKVKSFVDAVNGALGFIQAQSKLQKGKDGRESLGPMGGDSLLRMVESNFRRLLQNPQLGVQGSIKRLNEMGIEYTRNGTLSFSQDKFQAALARDPGAVAEFFRGDGFNVGFVPSVKREVSNLLNSAFGAIANRKRGLQQKIDQINQRIESKERQLTKREETLRRQFANLETKMSQLQSQGAALGGLQMAQQKAGGNT